MEYIVTFIIGILFGSIPTAYILLQAISNKNVTEEGSGNVGARNIFDITGSWFYAAIVFLIDFGKGLAVVYLVKFFFGDTFIYPALGLFAAVLSHNYNPWLGFKGGRGLATASGGLAFLAPLILLVWILLFIVAYLFRKNIHFGNVAATILVLALSVFNADILNKYSVPPAASGFIFAASISSLMILIFIRHIEPLKEWFRERKESIGRNNR